MNELLCGLESANLSSNPDFYKIKPDGKLLKSIQATLEETVYGQEEAMLNVSRAMLRSLAGLSDPNRPLFSALFCGATGVGKTAAGLAIAKYHYPQSEEEAEKHLKIVDCSNFSDDFDVHKLTGSNPGYVGYGDPPIITPEFLKSTNVIVFDEIEKAHPALHRVMLSILDQGRLQVPIGIAQYQSVRNTELNFANSTILFTSNIGSEQIRARQDGHSLGFVKQSDKQTNKDVGIKAVQEHFKHMPEFLNRLDTIVVFEDLKPPVFQRILNKFINESNNNQRFPNYLALTRELKDYVISQTDQKYGGRELRRALERLVLTPAAEVKVMLPAGVPFVGDLDDTGQVFFWASHSMEQEAVEAEKKEIEDIELSEEGTPEEE